MIGEEREKPRKEDDFSITLSRQPDGSYGPPQDEEKPENPRTVRGDVAGERPLSSEARDANEGINEIAALPELIAQFQAENHGWHDATVTPIMAEADAVILKGEHQPPHWDTKNRRKDQYVNGYIISQPLTIELPRTNRLARTFLATEKVSARVEIRLQYKPRQQMKNPSNPNDERLYVKDYFGSPMPTFTHREIYMETVVIVEDAKLDQWDNPPHLHYNQHRISPDYRATEEEEYVYISPFAVMNEEEYSTQRYEYGRHWMKTHQPSEVRAAITKYLNGIGLRWPQQQARLPELVLNRRAYAKKNTRRR